MPILQVREPASPTSRPRPGDASGGVLAKVEQTWGTRTDSMALALAGALRYFARRTEPVATAYQVIERAPAARESKSSRVEVRRVTALSDAEFREAVALLVKAFDGSTLFRLA